MLRRPEVKPPDGKVEAGEKSRSLPPLQGGPEWRNRVVYAAEIERLYPGQAIHRGPTDKKRVALTFDDGPDDVYTPRILDLLKKHEVKATFFLVGERVTWAPAVARRIFDEGHEVANHTWNHQNLAKLKLKDAIWQVDRADQEFRKMFGRSFKVFRPPYGFLTVESASALVERGYTLAYWNVDSFDWRGPTAAEVLEHVRPEIAPGAIVLFHSAASRPGELDGPVEALDKLIVELKEQGYAFVTISEMVAAFGDRKAAEGAQGK